MEQGTVEMAEYLYFDPWAYSVAGTSDPKERQDLRLREYPCQLSVGLIDNPRQRASHTLGLSTHARANEASQSAATTIRMPISDHCGYWPFCWGRPVLFSSRCPSRKLRASNSSGLRSSLPTMKQLNQDESDAVGNYEILLLFAVWIRLMPV